MIKKLLPLLVLVLAAGISLASCGQDDQNTEDTSLTDLQERGVLVLGCDDAFPPMGFREGDEIVGFDIDLAKAVAEKLGVELEIKAIDWETKEMELNSGNIDVIWNGYSIDSERNEKVEFTKPYLNNEIMIAVDADSDIETLADLEGKILGYQSDSSSEMAVNDNADLLASLGEVREYDNYQNALLDLTESSRIDAVAVDKILIEYLATTQPGKFKILTESIGTEYMGIGCPKDAVALREAIDTALDELYDDGTVAEISNKWFGTNVVIRDVPKLTTQELQEMGL